MKLTTNTLAGLALAVGLVLGLASTATAGGWGNGWGSKPNAFQFGGNFAVANKGETYGDKGEVKSKSWKHLTGEGGASTPGGAWATVYVGGGTTGMATASSKGHGPQKAGTSEAGALFGEGFSRVFRMRADD